MIEIFTLNLKPGKRDIFYQLYLTESLLLLKKWRINVVAYGPSVHDENSFYVIRSFLSLEDRQKKEDDFYNSADWKDGPRKAMLELIENTTTIVITEDIFKVWQERIKN